MNHQKLVVISDTHAHAWAAFGNGTGLNNVRLQRTLKVIKQSLTLAQKEDAIWIHGGDWIHTTGYVEHPASSALINLLNEYSDVPKVTTFGNHDARTQGGRITTEETFLYALEKAVGNLFVLNNSSFDRAGLTIRGWGAQNDIAFIEEQLEEADVGLFHQMVSGASFPSGMVTDHGMDPGLLRDHFNLSILGDIHNPHLDIDKSGKAILIPGSPEHHNFGDKGERGYWLVTMEKKDDGWWPTNFEDIESGSPKFLTVEDPSEVKDDGNYYRILGGSGDEVPDNAVAVKPSPTVVETRDLLEGAQNREEILKRWLELNPPETEGDFLGVGLKILRNYDETVPRKARIKRVEGENFFSYESLDYEVTDGIHLIVGESASYDSNGAGKSTAMEAIFWALFGKTTKGVSAADVIRWGADKTWVRLTIDLEGKELVVTRSRTETSINLEVFLDGEEITGYTNTELSKRLEGMLGLTDKLFKALGYFSQEDLVLLSRATDGELKELFADIRGLGAYQAAAAEAGEIAREKEEKRSKLLSRFDTLKEEIERDKNSLARIEEKKKEWEDTHQYQVQQLEEGVAQYRTNCAEVSSKTEERMDRVLPRTERLLEQAEDRRGDIFAEVAAQEFKKRSSALKVDIEQVKDALEDIEKPEASEQELQQLEGDLAEAVEGIIDEQNKEKSEKQALSWKIQTKKDTIEELEKKIQNLTVDEGSVCPTCGQDIAEDAYDHTISHHKERIQKLEKEIDHLLEEIEKVSSDIDFEEEIKKTKRKKRKVAALREEARRYTDLENELSNLQDKMDSVEELAESRAEKEADEWLSARQNQIRERVRLITSTLKRREEKAERKLKEAEKELERIEKEENPHEEHLQEQKRLLEERKDSLAKSEQKASEAKQELAIASYWQKGFGKSGLQSLLIEDFVTLFNKHRGRIFPVLTRGKYDVQMSAISTTQSGDEREKAEYRVFQDGKEVAYNALSGGQRRRVDLGVLLTTTLAASKAHGIPGALGILILDEVASYLDSDGAEALAETLVEYSPDVVPSVYVVSQDMSHKALYDDVMRVEQDENGISRIVS